MADHDHARALVGELAYGGGQALDAGEVGDPAVPHRHVEVGPQQHPPAGAVEVVDGPERGGGCHGQWAPNTAAVSAMRLEKPHSLSYQPHTRTSLPPSISAVWVLSNEQDAGWWLKSVLTQGSDE